MKHWEAICDIAESNYGIITAKQAKAVMDNPNVELPRWVKMGRLTNRGRGVYKLVRHTPTEYDQFAEAVALVGDGAHLHGESVLAINDLGFVNPPVVYVASGRRLRRKVPEWIEVVKLDREEEVSNSYGIPSQSLSDAIRVCHGRVPPNRLNDAIELAVKNGLLLRSEAKELKRELS